MRFAVELKVHVHIYIDVDIYDSNFEQGLALLRLYVGYVEEKFIIAKSRPCSINLGR